jgi:hypothetical protein
MAKIIVGILVLSVLLIFNPGVDAHREALLPYVEKGLNEAYDKGDWLSKIGFIVGGDALKSSVLDSVRRKSYGVFSIGYVGDEAVSFGILGYVYVFE